MGASVGKDRLERLSPVSGQILGASGDGRAVRPSQNARFSSSVRSGRGVDSRAILSQIAAVAALCSSTRSDDGADCSAILAQILAAVGGDADGMNRGVSGNTVGLCRFGQCLGSEPKARSISPYVGISAYVGTSA